MANLQNHSSHESFFSSSSKGEPFPCRCGARPLSDNWGGFLPITQRGRFFQDSFFENARTQFDAAVKDVLNRWSDGGLISSSNQDTANNFSRYRQLRSTNLKDDNQAFTMSSDSNNHKIALDVHDFREGDIKLKLIGEREILVEGTIEKKQNGTNSVQKFSRRFLLPEDSNVDAITSVMSSDGILTVNAPKKGTSQNAVNITVHKDTSPTANVANDASQSQKAFASTSKSSDDVQDRFCQNCFTKIQSENKSSCETINQNRPRTPVNVNYSSEPQRPQNQNTFGTQSMSQKMNVSSSLNSQANGFEAQSSNNLIPGPFSMQQQQQPQQPPPQQQQQQQPQQEHKHQQPPSQQQQQQPSQYQQQQQQQQPHQQQQQQQEHLQPQSQQHQQQHQGQNLSYQQKQQQQHHHQQQQQQQQQKQQLQQQQQQQEPQYQPQQFSNFQQQQQNYQQKVQQQHYQQEQQQQQQKQNVNDGSNMTETPKPPNVNITSTTENLSATDRTRDDNAIPITRRGPFFNDSFFENARKDFETAVQDVLSKWGEKSSIMDDFTTYRNLRSRDLREENQAVKATEDEQNYKFVLDVHDFMNGGDVNVKAVNDRELVVEGQVEKHEGGSKKTKRFMKRFVAPGDIILGLVTSVVSADGILTVTAPKKPPSIHIIDVTSPTMSPKETTPAANQSSMNMQAPGGSTSENVKRSYEFLTSEVRRTPSPGVFSIGGRRTPSPGVFPSEVYRTPSPGVQNTSTSTQKNQPKEYIIPMHIEGSSDKTKHESTSNRATPKETTPKTPMQGEHIIPVNIESRPTTPNTKLEQKNQATINNVQPKGSGDKSDLRKSPLNVMSPTHSGEHIIPVHVEKRSQEIEMNKSLHMVNSSDQNKMIHEAQGNLSPMSASSGEHIIPVHVEERPEKTEFINSNQSKNIPQTDKIKQSSPVISPSTGEHIIKLHIEEKSDMSPILSAHSNFKSEAQVTSAYDQKVKPDGKAGPSKNDSSNQYTNTDEVNVSGRILPIFRGGSFYDDSLFETYRNSFQTAVKDVLQQSPKQYNLDDISAYRHLRQQNMTNENQAFNIKEDEISHKVVLDARDFLEGDIAVSIVGERELLIEGRRENKNDASANSQAFCRRFLLPESVDVKSITSAISSDGILTVESQKKEIASQRSNIQKMSNEAYSQKETHSDSGHKWEEEDLKETTEQAPGYSSKSYETTYKARHHHTTKF